MTPTDARATVPRMDMTAPSRCDRSRYAYRDTASISSGERTLCRSRSGEQSNRHTLARRAAGADYSPSVRAYAFGTSASAAFAVAPTLGCMVSFGMNASWLTDTCMVRNRLPARTQTSYSLVLKPGVQVRYVP